MIRSKRVCSVFCAIWLYPGLIVFSVLAASLVTLANPGTALRPFFIIWFLCVCPGLTVVRFFQLNEMMIEWLLAVALSIAIDAGTAGMLLYTGRWSPAHSLIVLLCLCLVGAILQFVFIRTDTIDIAQRAEQKQG
jgi:hypothetical protein